MPAIVKKQRHRRMTLAALARRKIQQIGPYKCIPPPSTAFQHRFISQSLMRLVAL